MTIDWADMNVRLLLSQGLIFLVIIFCYIAWKFTEYVDLEKKKFQQKNLRK